MLVTLLTFLVMMVAFTLAGSLVLATTRLEFNNYHFAASALTGIVFFALIGQWCAYLALRSTYFWCAAISLMLAGILSLHRMNRLSPWVQSLNTYIVKLKSDWAFFAIPAISSFIYMTLSQGKWLSGEIAFRVGPDSFGWSDAINFFRDNLTLPELKKLIVPNLDGTPLFSALNVVHPVGSTAIYQIPSFTRQIDAEFLLGAHRTGATSMLGYFARLLPNTFTESVMVGFLMVSIFLMCHLGARYFKDLNQPIWYVIFGTIAISLNCNLLFQSLEGGVGELFVIPFIICAIVTVLTKSVNVSQLNYSLGLIIAIAFTSYFDILFTALPILGTVIIFQIFVKRYYSIFELLKGKPIWIFLALSFLPFASSFFRLAIVPFLHPTAGGWDIGKRPLPDNIFGILSSLPNRTENRTVLIIILEIIVSVALVFFVFLNRQGTGRFIFLILLGMYAYLFFSVYHQTPPYNNYRLWKYSAIASAIFPLLLVQEIPILTRTKNFASKTKKKSSAVLERKNWQTSLQIKSTFISISIFLISVSSLVWMFDWQSTKKLSFTNQEQSFISQNANHYDFVIDGSIYPAMVTMYGDIHYASPQRGPAGRLTHFSNPLRPILFLTNTKCSEINTGCLPQLIGYPGGVVAKDWLHFQDFNVLRTTVSKK